MKVQTTEVEKSKRFRYLDFLDRPAAKSKRFKKLDFAEVEGRELPVWGSMRFRRIGLSVWPEAFQRTFVVGAESPQYLRAYQPEFLLVVDTKTPEKKVGYWGERYHSDLREHLLKHGIFRVLDHGGRSWDGKPYSLVMTVDGPVAVAQWMRLGEGKKKLKLSSGRVVPCDGVLGVDKNLNSYLSGGREYVPGHFHYPGWGNIQFGFLDVAAVEQAIAYNDLPFEVARNRDGHPTKVRFNGPMDAFREARIYPKWGGKSPAWGIHYYYAPNESARKKEDWGGCSWPSKEAAQAAADLFEKTGEKMQCCNLKQLEAMFPGHPVIPAIREEQQARTRT